MKTKQEIIETLKEEGYRHFIISKVSLACSKAKYNDDLLENVDDLRAKLKIANEGLKELQLPTKELQELSQAKDSDMSAEDKDKLKQNIIKIGELQSERSEISGRIDYLAKIKEDIEKIEDHLADCISEYNLINSLYTAKEYENEVK